MAGSVADLIVEIAFTTDPLNTAPSWTDVSAYVLHAFGAPIERGRSSELADFQPGSCTLTLSNRDRRFDPAHTSGPYYGNLEPGKAIRIRGRWSAVNYPMFLGFIESWPQEYAPGNADATVTINAFDGLTVLSQMVQPDPVFKYTMTTIGSCELFLRNMSNGVWYDYSGYGRHATVSRDATYSGTDYFSLAATGATLGRGLLSSSVAGGRWSLNSAISLGTSYSVAFWFTSTTSIDTAGTGKTVPVLLGVPSYPRIELLSVNTVQSVRVTPASGVTVSAVGGFNPFDGFPHHVAFTYSAGTMALYVDGVLVGAGSSASSAGALQIFEMTDWSSTGTLPIAVSAPPTSETVMQDLTAFTKVLSAAEVLGLYQRGAGQLLETTSARLSRIIADTEWPSAWLSTTTNPKGVCLDYLPAFRTLTDLMADVAATEQGRLFVDASGVLQLHGRYYNQEVTVGKTSQVTFVDDGTNVPYAEVGTDLNLRDVYNDITVAASAGASANSTDAASITAYRRQAQSVVTLLPSAVEAKDMADGLVAIRKDAVTRLSQPLRVQPAVNTANWPAILALEIGQRVTFKITPMRNVGSQISRQMSIEGISWDITADDWHVSFDLAPVPLADAGFSIFVLDDPVYGVLDGPGRLGF